MIFELILSSERHRQLEIIDFYFEKIKRRQKKRLAVRIKYRKWCRATQTETKKNIQKGCSPGFF